MSEIEAGEGSRGVRRIGDGRKVEQLTGSEVDAAEHDGGEPVAEPFDLREDVFGSEKIFTRPRRHSDDVGGGISTSSRNVGLDGIGVAGKGAVLHEEDSAVAFGAVEGHHQQMQIDGQRVHRDDFGRKRPDDVSEAVSKILVIRIPRSRRIEVPLDAELRPVIEFLFDDRSRRDRLQAEGVSHEVRGVPAIRSLWKMKSTSESDERIEAVEMSGSRRGRIEIRSGDSVERKRRRCVWHGHRSTFIAETGRPRNSRAVPPRSRSRVASSNASIDRMSAPGTCSPSGNG